MNKLKNILIKIRIEEYFLFIFSILLFITYFIFFRSELNWSVSFKQELRNLSMGTKYFSFAIIFFLFMLFLKLYFWLSRKIFMALHRKELITAPKERIKNTLKEYRNALPILKLFLGIAVFFSSLIGIIGFFAFSFKGRLVNELMARIDLSLFGQYPFVWLQRPESFFRIFDSVILLSFGFISLAMSVTLIIFYLSNNRKFLSQYIISISLAVFISLPLWYFFPSNSPQNAFINNVYDSKISPEIKEAIKNYQPTERVAKFQGKVNEMQKTTPPISTMPSMHVAWAIIIAYLTFKFQRWLAIFFVPWMIFSNLGTVYLAQHYFVDIIAALPIAIIALYLSALLIKLEERYYRNAQQDARESAFKDKLKNDLLKLTVPTRIILAVVTRKGFSKKDTELMSDFLD